MHEAVATASDGLSFFQLFSLFSPILISYFVAESQARVSQPLGGAVKAVVILFWFELGSASQA